LKISDGQCVAQAPTKTRPLSGEFLLTTLGDVYEKLNKKQEALNSFNEAIRISHGIHAPSIEAAALNQLGVYADGGERQNALNYLKQSVELVRAVGDSRAEVIYLSNIGTLYMNWGELQHALEFTLMAITVAEKVRTEARLEEFKSTYDDYFADLYQSAVVLYMRLGRTAEAFNMTERARARGFLD
jgi:tetratricopeptide (TPR) repeat protein